jgi:hypothetical protein
MRCAWMSPRRAEELRHTSHPLPPCSPLDHCFDPRRTIALPFLPPRHVHAIVLARVQPYMQQLHVTLAIFSHAFDEDARGRRHSDEG